VWAERTPTATSAPRTTIKIEPDTDRVEIATWVAAGGKGAEGIGFLVTFGFATDPGALDKAGSWRCSGNEGR